MGMLKEFKEFAVKGNMIDMAVGIVIGAAFGKVISSLVGDLITPVLGVLTAGKSFEGMAANLTPNKTGDAAVMLKYGAFLQAIVDFLIVAAALFVVVKLINTAKNRFEAQKKAEPAAPDPQIKLLTEIRDALARR